MKKESDWIVWLLIVLVAANLIVSILIYNATLATGPLLGPSGAGGFGSAVPTAKKCYWTLWVHGGECTAWEQSVGCQQRTNPGDGAVWCDCTFEASCYKPCLYGDIPGCPSFTQCTNGVDDDNDAKIDCYDPGCWADSNVPDVCSLTDNKKESSNNRDIGAVPSGAD